MLRRLSEFLQPIPETELSMLRGHLWHAARALSGAMILLTPLHSAFDMLTGRGTLADQWSSGITLLAYVAIFTLARHRVARRNPDVLLLVLALTIITGIEVSEQVHDSISELRLMVTAVPVVLAAFVPWRPTLSVGLALAAGGVPIVGQWLQGSSWLVGPEVILFYVGVFGLFAALANQVQRRLWWRLESTRQRASMLSADRMASLGRLTAGIAHELKTPLAAMSNAQESARVLLDELWESIGHPDVEDADLREIAREISHCLEDVRDGSLRAARYVSAIRAQTVNMNQLAHVTFSVGERLESVRTLLAHRLKQSTAALDASGVDPSLQLEGDPNKLEQILVNLLTNALDAAEDHPAPVTVRVETIERVDGVRLVVQDDGPGIPPEIRDEIFEPLVSTRPADGTGLGLAISRDIAEGAFGGTLELRPSPVGARFELWCPYQGARQHAQEAWVPTSSAA